MALEARKIFLTPDDDFRQAFGQFLEGNFEQGIECLKTNPSSIKGLARGEIQIAIVDLSKPRGLAHPPSVSLGRQISAIKDLTARGVPVVVLTDRYTGVQLRYREHEKELPCIFRPPDHLVKRVKNGEFSEALAFGDLLPSIVAAAENPFVQVAQMRNAFAFRQARLDQENDLVLAKIAKSLTRSKKPHVLVVDYETMVSDVIAERLKDAGYRPIVCQYGAQANEALRTDPRIKAVIIDDALRRVGSGHVSGLDVVKCAAEHGVPPVLMSAYLERAGERLLPPYHYNRAGLPYLQKPFRGVQLLTRLSEAMLFADNCIQQMELGLIRMHANSVADSMRGHPGIAALVGAPVRRAPVAGDPAHRIAVLSGKPAPVARETAAPAPR